MSASVAVRAGILSSAGWQVTLCDHSWHVRLTKPSNFAIYLSLL